MSNPKRNSIESPIKIELKMMPAFRRRQSMMNPVPASLVVDKQFRNSLKRFSQNQDQILIQISKLSNFDIKEERDDSGSSDDDSFSHQVSPLKSNVKSKMLVSEDLSTSSHQINQFDKQRYFQCKVQKEEDSQIAQISDKDEDQGPINELEQNLLLSVYSEGIKRFDSVNG